MKKLYLIWVCLVPFFAHECIAQGIAAQFIDLPGPFKGSMSAMSRDDEGFIWFSTSQGLWRYDGTDIKLFDYKKLLLPQNTTPNILYNYGTYLFFCQLNGEIRVFNKLTGYCRLYKFDSWVSNFNVTANGSLLFFTHAGEAWSFSKQGQLTKLYSLSSFSGWAPGLFVNRSETDAKGETYVLLYTKIGRLSKNNIQWGPLLGIDSAGWQKKHFVVILSSAVSSKYIAAQYAGGELVIYDKHTLSPLYIYPGNQTSYCTVLNDEIVVIPHNPASQIPASPYFQVVKSLPEITKAYAASPLNSGMQAVLSTSAGLFQLKMHNSETAEAQTVKLVHFFHNKSIRSIYRANGALYVGSYSGFFKCMPDSIQQISTQAVYVAQRFDDSTLLLAIEGGPGFMLYNTYTSLFSNITDPGRDHNYYITALYHDKNYWWCGDVEELHTISNVSGRWLAQTALKHHGLNGARQIRRINGTLYVAAQNGLYKLTPQNTLVKIYPAKDSLRIYCMQEVSDGILLGTHGEGLVKIDSTGKVLQQIGFNEGLASNFVYSLAMLNNLLVAGTGSGASIFYIANGIQPLQVNKSDTLHGLITEECNHSAIYRDTAMQQVILGGVTGLVFINGREYNSKNNAFKNNRLILSYIKTGGHETATSEANLFAYATDKIILNPEDINVTLKFAAPGVSGETDGLFRILGLDDKWQRIDIGQEITLYALPPGTYTLQARMPTAISSAEWFTKTIVVKPAFYQTILFKVMLALCFLGIVYYFWRAKIKKIERELQLRTSIASDLHDDIGSTLNSISVYTEVAGQQLNRDTIKAKVLLDNMGAASRGMIDRMNDIVWAINPKNDDFENVLERMRFFAGELLSGKNMLLEFVVEEKIKKAKFTMQERKNIYLIYKEAINNAFKYSGGQTITVRLIKEDNMLIMAIADNGDGMAATQKSSGGNGLLNMQHRAKEIGGKLTIQSAHESGTIVQLTLRLRPVFSNNLPKQVGGNKINIRILQRWTKR